MKKSQNNRNQGFFHFLLVDGRIRNRIQIRAHKLRIRMQIQEVQKHTDSTDADPDADPDPEHCLRVPRIPTNAHAHTVNFITLFRILSEASRSQATCPPEYFATSAQVKNYGSRNNIHFSIVQ
jgi:hypothetical protein